MRRSGLVALAIAVVAVLGVHVVFDVLPAIDDDPVTVVAADHPADVAGQQVTLGSVRIAEFEAPTGSHTVSVRLHSSGGVDAATCGVFLLTEAESGRVWKSSRSGLGIPFDAGESSCIAEAAPYDILAVFLVPDDADGAFLLDITDDAGAVTRLEIEP